MHYSSVNSSLTHLGPDGVSIKRDEVASRTTLQASFTIYQSIVKFLLEQSDYPGISSEDLDRFKHQFCQSAFTYRLGKCYFATGGFKSKKLRDEHEMTHGKYILCPFADCKYPPLVSASSLKRHVKKFHFVEPARTPIRRPEKALKNRQPLDFNKSRRCGSSSKTHYSLFDVLDS
jgi:hypothetical protein